jgi:hypothetical protein
MTYVSTPYDNCQIMDEVCDEIFNRIFFPSKGEKTTYFDKRNIIKTFKTCIYCKKVDHLIKDCH